MAAELNVLILIQEGCHFCRDAQALLARLAGEYPLRIHTVDMATPEGEEMALQSGLLFPPGILLEGQPLCYGRPSEGKLRRAIEQLMTEDPTLDPISSRNGTCTALGGALSEGHRCGSSGSGGSK